MATTHLGLTNRRFADALVHLSKIPSAWNYGRA
jgi:hypothetical protein